MLSNKQNTFTIFLTLCVCAFVGFGYIWSNSKAADDSKDLGHKIPEKKLRIDYYTLEGQTTTELIESMEERKPYDYFAYTLWNVNWNYSFLMEPNSCKLLSFDVQSQSHQTLPKWIKREGASQATIKEWERYISALIIHENGHADIAYKATMEIQKMVDSKEWSDVSRKALRAKINAHCEKILIKYRKVEVQYDEDTDHGRTEGARLTPGI